MPLPHHSQYRVEKREDIPLVRFTRAARQWVSNLPSRAQCWVSGHWWRPHDLTSDECACCGARRSMRVKKELP